MDTAERPADVDGRLAAPSALRAILTHVLLGALHELVHLLAARYLCGATLSRSDLPRAALGRYSLVSVAGCDAEGGGERGRLLVAHSAWVFSVLLAVACHLLHVRAVRSGGRGAFAILACAAYVAALEAVSTDLLGLAPILPSDPSPADSAASEALMACFCGVAFASDRADNKDHAIPCRFNDFWLIASDI